MTSRREAMFSGAEPPLEHLALDLDRLVPFLAARLDGLEGPVVALKFKGGQSNPTYRLGGPGKSYVLRRRPPGTLVVSAHAIDREYRVLSALAAAGLPVPTPRLYCNDAELIGFEFYVVDFVPGRVFWDAELPGLEPAARTALYDDMNAVLAKLHALDADALGLGDLAPRENYATRNLARWSQIYQRSAMIDIPDMDWLIDTLPALLPADAPARLIHGDYGLYNIIAAPDARLVSAVLDWEMATLGDPLIDLAHHLRAWWDLPDPEGGAATSLRGHDLPALGIPAMNEYIALYAARRGIPVPDLRIYLAYAQFRYGAMIQGILKRAADGTAASRTVLHRQERVVEIARLARTTLEA